MKTFKKSINIHQGLPISSTNFSFPFSESLLFLDSTFPLSFLLSHFIELGVSLPVELWRFLKNMKIS